MSLDLIFVARFYKHITGFILANRSIDVRGLPPVHKQYRKAKRFVLCRCINSSKCTQGKSTTEKVSMQTGLIHASCMCLLACLYSVPVCVTGGRGDKGVHREKFLAGCLIHTLIINALNITGAPNMLLCSCTYLYSNLRKRHLKIAWLFTLVSYLHINIGWLKSMQSCSF